MTKKTTVMPKFASEAEEADWWASQEGRAFVQQRGAERRRKNTGLKGSRLVGQLNKSATVQIALRLPEPDLAKAREIATKKGIGYQTLLKMLVHEGLRREERRG